MNIDEKRYKNRKRCLACSHYGCNVCTLMGEADVFQIDNCILNNSKVKEIKEGSAEWFMFTQNPVLFLKYLNYQRKEKIPNIGSKVVTLRSGFGGYGGDTRYIKSIDEKCIILTNTLNEEGILYLSKIESWYNDFFEI